MQGQGFSLPPLLEMHSRPRGRVWPPQPRAAHSEMTQLEGGDLQDNRECLVEESSFKRLQNKKMEEGRKALEKARSKAALKGVLERKEQEAREKHQL